MVAPTVSAENGRHDKPGADEAVALQIAKELIDSKHPMNIESLLVSFFYSTNLTEIRLFRTLLLQYIMTAMFPG